jgi:dTDP-4-amino-4,6-dideoxygalactose transaminase
MELAGINGKMNEFQAAMGMCCLRYIDGELDKRKTADSQYRHRLENVEGIRLIPDKDCDTRNCTYFPILVDEESYGRTRDELAVKLLEQNITSKKYFTPLTPDFICYGGKFGDPDLPVARYMADRVLALPMHAYLSREDIDRVCGVIESRE